MKLFDDKDKSVVEDKGEKDKIKSKSKLKSEVKSKNEKSKENRKDGKKRERRSGKKAAEGVSDVADDRSSIKKGNYVYRIKDGFVEAKYGNNYLKLPYEAVKSIFDELPDEATVDDLLSVAEKLGVRMNKPKAYALASFFTHVLFDATISGGGKGGRSSKLRIIKPPSFSLNSEVKNKLKQELDVIGCGLQVSD